MILTVKLFAGFRIGRFKEKICEYPDSITAQDIILELGISEAELGVLMINGRHSSLKQPLADSYTVSLFPLVGGG